MWATWSRKATATLWATASTSRRGWKVLRSPGRFAFPEDAYRQVKGRLDLEVSDLGPTQLKNIAEPVRVYSLEVGAAAHATVATPSGRRNPRAASRLRRCSALALSALAIALLLAAGGAGWHFVGANRSPSIASTPPAEAAHLSIVVLPFANLSGDPSQDYFADGITENLTTDLSRLSGSFVIARNTAFTFKGKNADARQIGKELGVRYVLEGSVQRDQNQSARSMRSRSRRAKSGGHMWAERFDKPLSNLFSMQDEIVASLASQLGAELITDEARRAERTPNADSMDLYFQGMAGSTKGEIPPISRARAISLRVHWRLIPTISMQSLARRPDVQAATGYYGRQGRSLGQLRRT